MIKVLFFLSIIIYASPTYACQTQIYPIKSSYKDITLTNNQYYQEKCFQLKKAHISLEQKKAAPPIVFDYTYDVIPLEIQNIIIHDATNNSSARKPKEAVQTVRNLLLTNKYFSSFIDKPLFSDNLIQDFSIKYHCSHQTIAKLLHTKQSQQRLKLQYKLKELCCSPQDTLLLPQLNALISQGADLRFTYNHEGHQKTPLMISMSYDNNMFNYLLDQGADINGTNSAGMTSLHLAVSDPINEVYSLRLITDPTTAINHQNRWGETAFLFSLTHSKRGRNNRPLCRILREMLKAGAHPKCTNKKGLTTLKAAERLHNKVLITLVKNAINPKPKLTA